MKTLTQQYKYHSLYQHVKYISHWIHYLKLDFNVTSRGYNLDVNKK